MSRTAWVGVDLGTQSVRALALADDGTTLGVAVRPLESRRELDGPGGERHEQDPGSWWTAARDALRELTRSLPSDVVPRAIAVSATSGTVVAVSRADGTPTGPGVMYDDRRGTANLPRVANAGAELFARLGYRMQASWALPKIVALHEAGQLGPDQVVAHQPDVVTSRLAGRLLPSDLSSALKSGADLDAVAWPAEVLADLGLAVEQLNSLARSGDVLGEVGAEGAAETGLPVGCRIVAGMTDGCAAQLAAGALTPGSWNSVLGTTLVMKGAAAERRIDPTGTVYAHRAPFDGGWYPGGASSTGAGALPHWLPGRDLGALTDRVGLFPRGVPAYPLAGRGERFPFVADAAEAFFPAGVLVGSDAGVFTAVLSGVAWVERLAFDLLGLVGYDTTGQVLLTGGGARNPVWNQLRADVLGHPVQLPVHAEGAAGMAVLAAAGARAAEAPEERDPLGTAAARLVAAPHQVDPHPGRHRALMDVYRTFLDTLAQRGWVDANLLERAYAGAG